MGVGRLILNTFTFWLIRREVREQWVKMSSSYHRVGSLMSIEVYILEP